jgi:metal-responsive CopG/Arc/MetJ family transcriptional regulator
MKRSTIFIDEELEEDIKHVAKIKGKKVSQVIREALKEYIEKNRRKKKLSFIGIGKSGRKDVSETYEERLWDKE